LTLGFRVVICIHTDPNTQQWMMDNMQKVFGFPEIARFSWANTRLLLETEAIAAVEW